MDGDIHVMSIGDLINHQPTASCLCGPEQELVKDHDGHDAWVVTHHALDGREHTEPEHTEPDHDKHTCPLCTDA